MPVETAQELKSQPARAGSIVLVQVALRRRRTVIWTAGMVLLAAVATAALLPRMYTATMVLLPPHSTESTGAALLSQLGTLGAAASLGGGVSLKNPNDLQVSLLRSRTVEDAVAARFDLAKLYRRREISGVRKVWEKRTDVQNGVKDGLLRLSVTDSDPVRAAQLANGWFEEYRLRTAALAINEATPRRLFFETQLKEARRQLEQAEEALKQTEARTGVIEIESQAKAMIESAAALRARLAGKQVEIVALRQRAAAQNPDLLRAEQESSALASELAAMDLARERSEGDLVEPKGSAPQDGLEYTRAVREVKYRETLVQLVARQYEAARVDEAREGAPIEVVDAAAVPDRPASALRWWVLLGGALAALPLGFAAAAAGELISLIHQARRDAGDWAGALDLIAAWSSR